MHTCLFLISSIR